jgi:hypothetical protein
MEGLSTALSLNRVHGDWEKFAYFSKKPLIDWYADLQARVV